VIGRRHALAMLAGFAGVWPALARAQAAVPVLGYLGSGAPDDAADSLPGLHQGLREAGYVEGDNLAIEFRWAEGDYDRLPALAADLIVRRVTVILCGALPATVAAKQATATIPIVFVMGADPVKQGIVESLARPGGNLTGVTQLYGALGGKRLELLRDLMPAAATIAVLSNPSNPNARNHLGDVRAAAHALGKRVEVLDASSPAEVDAAFAAMPKRGIGAALVADDPAFRGWRRQIVALAAQHRVPTVHFGRDFVVEGGLISYGSSTRENMRLAGGYIARILKGARPAELPVLQPVAFELVVNLRAARALGLDVPAVLLERADEVIE
jgi:putative tryptophan/tyrosine transport system substrate-binding protein